MNHKLSRLLATVLIIAMLLGVLQMSISMVKAQPPAPCMYLVGPSGTGSQTFYTNTTGVGSTFTVTAWINTTYAEGGWVGAFFFNNTQLNVVSTAFTANDSSQSAWFYDQGIYAPGTGTAPFLDDVTPPTYSNTAGTIGEPNGFGEIAMGTAALSASVDTLFTITFKVMILPPTGPGNNITSEVTWDPNISFISTILGVADPNASFGNFVYTLANPSAPPPPPLSVTISPLSSAVTVGQTVQFNSVVSGGKSPYSYQWYLNGTSVGGATTNSWSYTPSGSEYDTVYLAVTDSNGVNAYSSVASITATQPFSGTMLQVNPAEVFSLTMGPSSSFAVNVTVSNVTNLAFCTFNVTYDPTIISCVGFEGFQVQGLFPTLDAVTRGDEGYAWMSLNYSGPVSVSAAPLVQLYFDVVAYGISPINLTGVQLLDNQGNTITTGVSNGLFANVIRQVAVINVVPLSNLAYIGFTDTINVTVANLGTYFNETFTASAYYNSSLIGTVPIVNLPPGQNITVAIVWDTTGVPEGNYTITGVASPVPYESNTAENVYVDGVVQVVPLIQQLAITNVTPSLSLAYSGQIISINVTAENLGNRAESFQVNATTVFGLLGSFPVANLAPNANITLTFTWNTTGVPAGNYGITGLCTVLPYETNTTGNVLTSSPVTIVIRDIAITNVTYSPGLIYQGVLVNIYVTAANLGGLSESFNVSAYYNSTLIGMQPVTNLSPNATTTLTFVWNTTSVSSGAYMLTGSCTILPYEINTQNNVYTIGPVNVFVQSVAITNFVTSPQYGTSNGVLSWVYQGRTIQFNTTVTNFGTQTESFDISLLYNTTQITSVPIVLAASTSFTWVYNWSTTSVPCHNYIITVELSGLPYNVNSTNTIVSTGIITIRLLGDVNGDGVVNMKDLALVARAFGSSIGPPPSSNWNAAADVNYDGVINMRDVALVARNFGTSTTY